MLVSVVVPEKLPGQKLWRKRWWWWWIFEHFDVFLKLPWHMTICNFLNVYMFILRGQHTYTNIGSILSFFPFFSSGRQKFSPNRYT